LSDNSLELTGAHFVYDLACASAADGSLLPLVFHALDRGNVHSVDIREALKDIYHGMLGIDPDTFADFKRYSLALLARRYLGVDRTTVKKGPDSWRMRYAELDGVPLHLWPPEATSYPLDDAADTLAVHLKQQNMPNLHDEPEQMRGAWGLYLSRCYGLRTDPVLVPSVIADIERVHANTLARFSAVGIYRGEGYCRLSFGCVHGNGVPHKAVPGRCKAWLKSNVGSKDTKYLAALVSQAYEGDPPKTDTGRVKCDRDALKESGSELLEELAEAGANEKLHSTYAKVLALGVQTSINPDIDSLVSSGRPSCADPNLYNLPRAGLIRDCFIPRTGYVYSFCDYPTAELRALAQICYWLCGRSAMRDALMTDGGQDLHCLLAAQVDSVPYADFMARIGAKEKKAKDLRQMCKSVNFGLGGGLGAFKLVAFARQSYGVRICESAHRLEKCGSQGKVKGRNNATACRVCVELATELKRLWLKTWPEMNEFFAWIKYNTNGGTGGKIEQFVSRRVRGNVGYTDGANTTFQGLVADIFKRAFYRISKESYIGEWATPDCAANEGASPLLGCRPVIALYDESGLEMRYARANGPALVHAAAARQAYIMRYTFAEFCPDIPINGTDSALSVRWLKGLDPVHDASGLSLAQDRCACGEVTSIDWQSGNALPHKGPDKQPCSVGHRWGYHVAQGAWAA
jgi:hypothetical protein